MSFKTKRKLDNSLLVISKIIQEAETSNDVYELEIAVERIIFEYQKIENYKLLLSKKHPQLLSDSYTYIEQLKKRMKVLCEPLFNLYIKRYSVRKTYDELLHMDKLLTLGVKGVLEKEGLISRYYFEEFDFIYKELISNFNVNRKIIIYSGPTNSGKTYAALERLMNSGSGAYLSPLRALAIENYNKLNLNGVPCSLLTGDDQVDIPYSEHISSTIEMVDLKKQYDCVVIDEGQLIDDVERGFAWTKSIFKIKANEIHICCSLGGSAAYKELLDYFGVEYEIKEKDRTTRLLKEEKVFEYPLDVRKGDALVLFSRNRAINVFEELKSNGLKVGLLYGDLPPEVRNNQIELFENGANDIIVCTDAIGMGVNLPIKRVVFLEKEKYDGLDDRELLVQEVKQLAGRAGRKGIYEQGLFTSTSDLEFFAGKLSEKDDDIIPTFFPEQLVENAESILEIEEILNYWGRYKPIYDDINFKKGDLSSMKGLISRIKEEYENENINDPILKEMIFVPFDVTKDAYFDYWISSVDDLITGKKVKKPKIKDVNKIDCLEEYYHLLCIYKNIVLRMGENKRVIDIEREKEKVSEQIISYINKR